MLFSIRSGTGLLGVEVIDLVFVLNTDKAVEAFAKGHNFQVGADISFAVGPLGRNAEGQLNLKALSAVLTYSHSKGLYLGLLSTLYGGHNAESILKGGVPKPAFAASLYAALGEVESATEP
ncbi:DUF500-domain-containing protein [Rhizoclosmatium globosum]|uniref:DUF500-domain-containing protein n=1 Tax=Rhizoclosmatium globosum TaxID=329046 RepID=A0A1Y2CAC7_9FUNG|nr:DUF500-domain-containing protein [Rhizoclosmatium globosum]|eukprot:ORY43981.1 DUF500-domain-containing protein [Rhizoclosmatium globosum]